MALRLVVDSSLDLPRDLVREKNVTVVPLTILFGEKEYFDGVDLTPNEFYEKLASEPVPPKTAQVPPARFIEAFESILAEGDEVLCITIGSNASGTCQSAFLAKQQLDTDRVLVIDSNGLCMGAGYLALLALSGIEAGKTKEEIAASLEPLTKNRIEHLFCVDTLEYLKRGGRVKAFEAFMGGLLSIKPILTVEDAITKPVAKVRGRKRIIPHYLEHMAQNMDFEGSPFLSVAHAADPDFADQFIQAFSERFSWDKPVHVSEIGATIGTHAGPGVLAAFYQKKD